MYRTGAFPHKSKNEDVSSFVHIIKRTARLKVYNWQCVTGFVINIKK